MELTTANALVEEKIFPKLEVLSGIDRRAVKRAIEAGMILSWRQGFREGREEGGRFPPLELGGEA